MSQAVLVGEAPGPTGGEEHPLFPIPWQSAGGRLCHRIMAVSTTTYLRSFDRMNLIAKGPWKQGQARQTAQAVRRVLHGRTVILLGRKVMSAFGYGDQWPFFDTRIEKPEGKWLRPITFVFLPHPSGRNHVWNDPETIPLAWALLAAHIPSVTFGATCKVVGQSRERERAVDRSA